MVTLFDVSALAGHHAMPAALFFILLSILNFTLSYVEHEMLFTTSGPGLIRCKDKLR